MRPNFILHSAVQTMYFYPLILFLAAIFMTFSSRISRAHPDIDPASAVRSGHIIIPERPTAIERHAAEELGVYIHKITGEEMAVIRERGKPERFAFYIGRTRTGIPYCPEKRLPYEGANGFRIVTVPDGLVIAGGDDLSTLYGVYEFLETYQGCAWILPYDWGEVVPRRKDINIPDNIDITVIPDIPIRWAGTRGDWLLKNRMNAAVQLNGHSVGVINKWHYHSFDVLLPPGKYFGDHAEYYALPESGRTGTGNWQICMSNPEAVRAIAGNILRTVRRNPDIQVLAISPNDWRGWCRCPNCLDLKEPERSEDPYGSESGAIFAFNNAIARRIQRHFPGLLIKAGAYFHNYQRYPLDPSYKPEENLAIQVCHLGFCHNHAIDDASCPYNRDFMDELTRWADNTEHLQVYEYTCLAGWANLIWPMVHCLRRDMPLYHRCGTELFYIQVGSLTQHHALNYYVWNKLAWDSSRDVDALITEFCGKSYGAAGPAMERYHRFIENNWEDNGIHFSYMTEPVSTALPKFFPPEFLAHAENLLRTAESIQADSLSRVRMQWARLDFEYLQQVMNYLEAIGKPFAGVNHEENPAAWDRAAREAASIGAPLSAGIIGFLREHYPESMLANYWRGVDRLMNTHKNPGNIPGAERR